MAVSKHPPRVAILPLINNPVLFPSLVLRLTIERTDIQSLLSKLVAGGGQPQVACVPQRLDATYSSDILTAPFDEVVSNLGHIGCLGKVLRVEKGSAGVIAVIEGLHRVQVRSASISSKGNDGLMADVNHHDHKSVVSNNEETQGRLSSLKAASTELITTLKGLKLPALLIRRLESFIDKAEANNAGQLCDLMVSVVESSLQDKIAVLNCIDVSERLKLVHELVSKQLNTIKVSRKISSSVDQTLNKQQKEFILRQKLNAIKKELGQLNGDTEDDVEEDDVAEYRKKMAAAELSPDAKVVVEKEIKRLKRMQPQQAEYQVIRTYLDNILEIPWTKTSQSQSLENSSIKAARRILDEDHFGLEKVKTRLIEYLAILRLRQTLDRERHESASTVKLDSKL